MPLSNPLPGSDVCRLQTRYAPRHPSDRTSFADRFSIEVLHKVHLAGSTSTYILVRLRHEPHVSWDESCASLDSRASYVVMRRVRGIGSCLPHPRILAALRRRHPESPTLRGILWEPSRLPEAQREDFRNGRVRVDPVSNGNVRVRPPAPPGLCTPLDGDGDGDTVDIATTRLTSCALCNITLLRANSDCLTFARRRECSVSPFSECTGPYYDGYTWRSVSIPRVLPSGKVMFDTERKVVKERMTRLYVYTTETDPVRIDRVLESYCEKFCTPTAAWKRGFKQPGALG